MFGCVHSMPGGRFTRVFIIFVGFWKFGLGIENVENSVFLKIFEHVGFGPESDRVKSVRDQSGGNS